MRRHSQLEQENHDFWPAFTDLISTVSLVLFLVMLMAIAQAAISARFTVEGSKRIQAIFEERAKRTKTLLAEIGAGNGNMDDSAAIRFNGDVLFSMDSADLTKDAREKVLPPVANALGRVLSQYGSYIDTVIIEGHTAGPLDDPDGEQWLLGARRAVAVLTYLQQVNPDLRKPEIGKKLSAASFSYYRPPSSPESIKNIPLAGCRANVEGECEPIRRIEIRLVLADQGLADEIKAAMHGGMK